MGFYFADMVLLDKQEISFPDPALYHPEDGLLAIGGDLCPERIRFAYELGIFPWFNPGEEMLWWSPDPRFVLFPEEIKVSKSMKKVMREGSFTFTENSCFEEVMTRCGQVPRKDQDGTWISEEMLAAYAELHRQGSARSVEAWQGQALVGGFYGIEVGAVFCGESMFSEVSNASKAALIWFVQKHAERYRLIDCQVYSAHLESMGAKSISKKEFLDHLPRNNAEVKNK